MRRIWNVLTLVGLLAGLLLLPTTPALSLVGPGALTACRDAAFSTEEDFVMRRGEPADGNPHISDGDLLSPSGAVCARNADLLNVFKIGNDLGLDAVDIINVSEYWVAFSTELDAPDGGFTAGDLLDTKGAVIPNLALVKPFGVFYGIGLDEVKFIGTEQKIKDFLAEVLRRGRSYWLEGTILQGVLKQFNVDIWFSTEGDWVPPQGTGFLDGDILSAANGTIVLKQADLLPASVPAGIPSRGVDFGLDAFAVSRSGDPQTVYFSTEILYNDPENSLSFTDGDVLRKGDGVVAVNWDLVKGFNPAARFLGLDALFIGMAEPPPNPNLQTMCGKAAADFDGGMVAPGLGGTGLYSETFAAAPPGLPPRRPCGAFVPIDGYLPATGVIRFRVAYRLAGTPVPAIGAATGIVTNWNLRAWQAFPVMGCWGSATLGADASGWMNAANYLAAKSGMLTGCANSGLRLAVWNTTALATELAQNAHYVVWLEWEDAGGMHREPFEHHLQLDNKLPVTPAYPNGVQVRVSDTITVPACGRTPTGTSLLQVWGQFSDPYYWRFSLALRGGSPPASASFGPHNYWDVDDGTTLVKNTNGTGTTPLGGLRYLRNINMTALGASFKDCCYVLDMYVYDAAIRYSFNGYEANDNSGSYYSWAFVTFAAAP